MQMLVVYIERPAADTCVQFCMSMKSKIWQR